MADAFSSTSTLSAAVLSSVDQYVRAELRHQPLLRNVADTRPVQVDRPGSSVALYTRGDMAVSTTPLSETTDPDAVAIPTVTPVTLTPLEYGNMSIGTAKLGATSFFDIDPHQRDSITWNMRDTLDTLVGTVLTGGTNVRFAEAQANRAALTSQHNITAADVRYIVAKLRANAAQGTEGDLYWAGIHPDVAHDLRADTSTANWTELHKYAAPGHFWPGVIGVFEGAFFVETARMPKATGADGTDAGSNPDVVYHTVFAGREALAEGVVVEPEVRSGTIPDKFNRFVPLGWYGYLGWTRFREKALYRLEAGSSIADNT